MPSDWVCGGDERRSVLARYRDVRANEYTQDLLYVAPDRSFSIVMLTWAPGAQTCIHDHAAWCAVAVYEGVEHEQRYCLSADSGGSYLTATATRALEGGATAGMLADGSDIHRVGNYSRDATLSLHVYGLDVKQSGTSIKTRFDALPVRT